MAEESPFGLTNENQSFDELREEDPVTTQGQNSQATKNPSLNEGLSDDHQTTIRSYNEQEQNLDNTLSVGEKSNALGTEYTTGIMSTSGYFNYRGKNIQNFIDPNYEDDQHVLTVDSIIEYFKKYSSLRMKYSHFAYMKKLGVYPNNRMIIARRYGAPTANNMFDVNGQAPIATVVSWMDPNESLLQISFNEKWEDATESLLDIFKEILSNDLGVNLDPPIPIPGFTVGLQYGIMNALGLTNADNNNVPQGNPNLVHETKRRKVPGDDIGGSGLESDFRIKMVCEYEQKYIGRIDPSVAYLDIIGNLLRMGTSNEEFLLTGAASDALQQMFNLAKEGNWVELASLIIEKIVEGIGTLVEKISGLLSSDGGDGGGGGNSEQYSTTYGEGQSTPSQKEVVTGFQSGIGKFVDIVKDLGSAILSGIFSKYREKIKGAIAAMSGMPNGPWHIMMGNPKNPFFVSGDMICSKITIDFKSELAYNDLPAEFTATLEFEPARSLGRVGIGSRFNSGKGRIYGKGTKNTTAANGDIGQSKANVQKNTSQSNL